MKKLFFYAVAALAMLASCKKAEVNDTPATPVDDSKPVAMQFSASSPSFTVTKTKAAVDEWNATAGTPVFIYGIIPSYGADADDNTNPIVINNYPTVVKNETDKLDVYADANNSVPYFYTEGVTYDFYGYHLGTAAIGDDGISAAYNAITIPVTIDGSHDLMYAMAEKSEDIKKATSDVVLEGDAYSSWAARRGVHPTLVFNHALSRFNFEVIGMNEKAENVTITGIKMTGMSNTGTLTVVGETRGFAADAIADGATGVDLVLKNADDTEYTSQVVDYNNAFIAGNGSCLMVAPDLAEVNVVVSMVNNEYNDSPLTDYNFTVNASDVVLEGEPAGLQKFEAGKAYKITIKVYGPEEIQIYAQLTDWVEGGDYTYDPDQRPSEDSVTGVTANLLSVDASAGTVTYGYVAADGLTVQAALTNSATAPTDDADWTTANTTKSQSLYITFDVSNYEGLYHHVRYAETPAEGEISWTGVTPTSTNVSEEVAEEAGAVEETPGEGETTPESVTITQTAVLAEENAYNDFYSGTTAPSYADALAGGTLPWVGFKLNPFEEEVTLNITLTYDGSPMPFNEPANSDWYTRSNDNLTATVVLPAGITSISFEAVAELGFEAGVMPDATKVLFTVTK